MRACLHPQQATQAHHAKGKTKRLLDVLFAGLIIAYIGWIWGFWDFLLGSIFYPRIRPHNPAIQIDTIHAPLFPQGPPGR